MNSTDSDDSFIEVVGEGRFTEEIESFIAEVSIAVPATKKSTASERGGPFVKKCISALLAGGVEPDEIKDGGVRLGRDWRTQRSQIAHKLVLQSRDLSRLVSALQSVETAGKQRKLVTANMRPPIFGASQAATDQAGIAAIAQATHKANLIAENCGVLLGRVLRVEEAARTTKASGFMGDEGSPWPSGMLRRRSLPQADEPLETPSRIVTISLRIRFAIAPK